MAFEQAYGLLGYAPCDGVQLEPGFQKIAVYAKGLVPTHTARQLSDGSWTSKLGTLEDIKHDTLDAVEGDLYGQVAILLRRSTASTREKQ
jgi:hypothetical protein